MWLALYTGVNPIYIEGRGGHVRSDILTVLQALDVLIDFMLTPI
jgi:hypothetical protein